MQTERESKIEKAIRELAISLGWLCWKFVSPGLRGVPDRIFMKDGRVVFIEIKRVGEEPTPQQQRRAQDLADHGCEVHWVDSVRAARVILTR